MFLKFFAFIPCIHVEIIDMLRKMLLTGILVYVRPSSARPVVATIICLLSSSLLNYYQPYKNRILLWMAQGSFLLTALKYLLTVLGVLLDLSPENKTLMGGILIFFDCLVIVSGLLCTVAIFVVLKSTAEKVNEIQKEVAKQNHVVVPTNTNHTMRRMRSAARTARAHLSLAHLQKALDQRAVGRVEEQAETALKHFKKVQEQRKTKTNTNERMNKRLVRRQDAQEEQQQRSMLHKEILVLKWQKNIRQTLMKNTQVVPATTANMPSRVKSTRTRKVEEIEKNHQSYRNMAVRNIQQQQVQRRNSLQLRVQARNVKRGRTNVANRALETTIGGVLMDDKAAALAATLALDQTKKHVERIETLRLALCKVVKTPAKFFKWLRKNDKASNGLLLRVDFGKVIGKVAQRVGEKGEATESLMEAIWVSVKEGSGKEVALDVVEHQVVARWVFGN